MPQDVTQNPTPAHHPEPNQDRLLDLFKTLCQVNAPALQERACADLVIAHLQSLGLQVHEDGAAAKIGGDTGNIIAKLPANTPGAPAIFLSAHLDTVEPTAGLVIHEENGVLSSASDTILGADDKAGMAPAIEAVTLLIESQAPHGDVYLLFSPAEEIGLLGAGALDIQSLGVDYGYVLDTGPPVGTFVNRTATHDQLEVTIHGKPAHAGKEPEKGVSAIQVAARAIDRMRLGRIAPETTANVGVIQGGHSTNVVTPLLTFRAEVRSTDLAQLDQQINHMVETIQEAATHFGAKTEIQHHRHYQAYHLPESEPVVQRALAASRALGHTPALRTTLGGSDANQYNAKGVPTLVVATGMDKIHTHEENVSIQDLEKTTRLAYRLLLADPTA